MQIFLSFCYVFQEKDVILHVQKRNSDLKAQSETWQSNN